MVNKVYYLDDEIELCDLFKDLFETPKVEISVFNNVDDFLSAVETTPPNLCFFDYRLPGTTGDIVASKIDKNIPKYLVSGDLNQNSQSLFVKILPKPFDIPGIQQVIESYSV